MSQLIPVIVSLVANNDGLVAIEQPELHIHPAVQVGVGDLIAAAATAKSLDLDSERCLLIETHSEHIMLRLLRRIRETSENELPPGAPSLTPGHVAVIYVEPTEDVLRLNTLRILTMLSVILDDHGRVSLHPSVWLQTGCRSHFWVREGKVVWCD